MNNEEDTLVNVIKTLKERGYTTDFNANNADLQDGDFVIDKVYRFEGNTDMEDEAVLYAISAKNNSVKGILVNGYGIYSDDKASRILNLKK
jgi:hypothetical protein